MIAAQPAATAEVEPDLLLATANATESLGAMLGALLGPGDVVYLIGDLGAGKSTLARAAIQTRLDSDEPVPSPTFTLTQHYQADGLEIVHADLYRLGDPGELDEIGLGDGDTRAALLIEWPDRLDPAAFPERLEIHLDMYGDGRSAALVAFGARATELRKALMLDRDVLRARFIDVHLPDARVEAIPGDASRRRYFRLDQGGETAILMDSPREAGEDVRPFVSVTQMLRARGLSAPGLRASDAARGFLLLEDLGDAIFSRLCARGAAPEAELYAAATDLLGALDATPADSVPPYDGETLIREADLLIDWWWPACDTEVSDDLRAEYRSLIQAALKDVAAERGTLVLRDYHADNLVWLPGREGIARVGLLDYQDALLGHPAYDLVSLLEDARRDVDPDLAAAMIERFLAARAPGERDALRCAYDALGAQRNAKIVGIFARLCLRDGKPRYLDMIPRVWAHLQRDLSAPHLAALRQFFASHVPPPEPERLRAIAARAGSRASA